MQTQALWTAVVLSSAVADLTAHGRATVFPHRGDSISPMCESIIDLGVGAFELGAALESGPLVF